MRYIAKSIEWPISVCTDENNEDHYILRRDLPDEAKDGDQLYEDKLGRIRIDEVNSRRKNKT